MKFAHDIIIRPVLTEKSYDNMANKTYAFIVDKRATKTEVKSAIEEIFGVQVDSVNTVNNLGKNYGHGDHGAVFPEHLGHAQLSAQNSFLHLSYTSVA